LVESDTIAKWRRLPSARRAKTVQLEAVATAQSVEAFRSSYVSDAPPTSIEPMDGGWCRIRSGQRTTVVSRYCPHEGADLTCGYIQNGRIYCPFHHLHYDVETGQAPSGPFAPLKVMVGGFKNDVTGPPGLENL
jgi:Rieske Fe-S protein